MESKVGSQAAVLLFVLQVTHILAKNVLVHFRLGGTLSLSPTQFTPPITSILWRHDENLVAEWIKDTIDLKYYGTFVNRAELDLNTGHLRITGATEADKGVFSVEINNVGQDGRYEARMVKNVPKVHAWVKPGPNSYLYILYCDPEPGQDADLQAAEPVSYWWKIGTADWVEFGSKLEIEVNETTVKAETFRCQIRNPVSDKTSEPKRNPFYGQVPWQKLVGAAAGVLCVGGLCVAGVVYAYKKKKFPFHRTGNAPVSPDENEMEKDELKSAGSASGGSA